MGREHIGSTNIDFSGPVGKEAMTIFSGRIAIAILENNPSNPETQRQHKLLPPRSLAEREDRIALRAQQIAAMGKDPNLANATTTRTSHALHEAGSRPTPAIHLSLSPQHSKT